MPTTRVFSVAWRVASEVRSMKRLLLVALLVAACGTKNRPDTQNIRERSKDPRERIFCNCWNLEDCRYIYEHPPPHFRRNAAQVLADLEGLEERCSWPFARYFL